MVALVTPTWAHAAAILQEMFTLFKDVWEAKNIENTRVGGGAGGWFLYYLQGVIAC